MPPSGLLKHSVYSAAAKRTKEVSQTKRQAEEEEENKK
jgi:hypothetical protein